MDSNDTFLKWFQIITTKYPLNRSDLSLCIKELLPGFSYQRSADGPRAIKFIYDEADKQVFRSNFNYDVGMQALRMAADTDYKKAILTAYDTKREINNLLNDLKIKLKFDLDISIDKGKVDIRVKYRNPESGTKKLILW